MLQSGSYQGYKLRRYWVIIPSTSSEQQVTSHPFTYSTLTMASKTKSSTTTVGTPTNVCLPHFSSVLRLVNKIVTNREHPEVLRPHISEIEEFSHHNFFNVLHPILQYVHYLHSGSGTDSKSYKTDFSRSALNFPRIASSTCTSTKLPERAGVSFIRLFPFRV